MIRIHRLRHICDKEGNPDLGRTALIGAVGFKTGEIFWGFGTAPDEIAFCPLCRERLPMRLGEGQISGPFVRKESATD